MLVYLIYIYIHTYVFILLRELPNLDLTVIIYCTLGLVKVHTQVLNDKRVAQHKIYQFVVFHNIALHSYIHYTHIYFNFYSYQDL